MSQLMQSRLKTLSTQAKVKKQKSASDFIQEVRVELSKVNWTSREELTSCTKAVLGAIFFLGLGIYLVDIVIKGVLDLVRASVLHIFG